ncbi:MAG: diadenylate cyclase [Deltaproteobacteria bacterium]|nr:diadenylate cyclase [Deltaproteobacteria bacterium]
MPSSNELIMEFACRLAEEIKARAIVLYQEVAQDILVKIEKKRCYETILITRNVEDISKSLQDAVKLISIPGVKVTRLSQIKIAITKGIAAGLFTKGDKLVCLTGIPKFGCLDSLFVIDVGKEFEIFTSDDNAVMFEGASPEVFETALNIALELAAQGREGRPVGTIFVIGDHEKVLELSRQMIINPFQGYTEDQRNILDLSLKDTIKEFSALDGAFVIKENGALITAGRHLNAALEGKDFPQGLGSRHIAAAGITSVTNAIAIVVSESTGTVRIFKKGRIFVDIEKGTD